MEIEYIYADIKDNTMIGKAEMNGMPAMVVFEDGKCINLMEKIFLPKVGEKYKVKRIGVTGTTVCRVILYTPDEDKADDMPSYRYGNLKRTYQFFGLVEVEEVKMNGKEDFIVVFRPL
jgi:hypothetical protein